MKGELKKGSMVVYRLPGLGDYYQSGRVQLMGESFVILDDQTTIRKKDIMEVMG